MVYQLLDLLTLPEELIQTPTLESCLRNGNGVTATAASGFPGLSAVHSVSHSIESDQSALGQEREGARIDVLASSSTGGNEKGEGALLTGRMHMLNT